ncbi:cytochrome C [candidate division KSB1 bacterium]|nr:cytochrome C [candidate division KSB1 bacterium]NIS23529.1 cytochrome C [candidate division KSB1 bacterium]NIT70459.1 cytochrome C [candidate division KSB1 bacterium]NIU24156.1 cytochrome C [candidate division KSB1 bacterium]NIU93410.1 cytochrome C [candidate division KSB1 bacterium]
MKKRLPSLFYNPLSMFGAIVAIVNFLAILIIVLIDTLVVGLAPYAGIIAFIILPAVLFLGLILIPVGMYFERRRRIRQEEAEPRSFYVDLGKPSHRLATMIFISGSIIFLLATAVGSYRAYEFTESVTFCGRICHEVMDPEHTAYQNSPHARVTCVDCHVGAGAGWFVKSKLSGAYQVYATVFNTYPKPIPTPIENLRPARETCEQCHWPDKFHGSQERVFDHYMVDEENTKWSIRMLVKTGGGSKEAGIAQGIHWHMNIANEIDYIATDEQRQEIAWVRIKDLEGNVREYMNEDNPIEPEDFDNYEMRRMDCIDCHNRPTHIYKSPSKAVNNAFTAGRIDASLPGAKGIAIEALIEEYPTQDSALVAIEKQIIEAYEDEYPEVLETRQEDVNRMIASVQDIYRKNFFPEMKVRWDVYPDNIGHFLSPGCYRCHNGRFVSDDGDVISDDCNNCHIILSQGNGTDSQMIDPDGLEFKHPVDIEEAWRELACSECHTGTSQL